MFREGDIVRIPLSRDRNAIGWILHLSQHFKNAVGFIVFGIEGELASDAMFDVETGQCSSIRVLGPLYTHIGALSHYGWKAIAHRELTESKRSLTKRRVGGDVYVADSYLGTVEDVGGEDLKPMLVMGMPVVYREIEKAFGNGR